MVKPKQPEQKAEVTEIVTDATGDVVNSGAPVAEASRSPKIVIDGVEYDATNLSDPAKGAIASLQFAEAKLMALQNELSICQTAHYAYVKGLKTEIEGKAG